MKSMAERTWPHVWRAVKFRPGLYFLMTVQETIVFTGFPLAAGALVRWFFNSVEASSAAGVSPLTICALVLGAALARGLIFITNFLAFFYHAGALSTWLRRNMLDRILREPGARALPGSTGEAVSRFRGDVRGIGDLLEKLNFLIEWSVFAVVGIAIMARINPRITAAVLVPLCAVVLAASLSKRWIQSLHRRAREATGKVTGFIAEMYGSVQTVKVSAAETRVLERFGHLNDRRRECEVRERLFRSLLSSFMGNAASIGTGLILILSGQAMRSGTFTVGDFALFVVYVGVITEFVAHVGEYSAMFRQTAVTLKRLFGILGTAPVSDLTERAEIHLRGPLPEIEEPRREAADRLVCLDARGLSYRYAEGSFVLQKTDIRVARGEIVVIVGRIGSGKSTLLRVLLGLLPPDAGEVRWNGAVVQDPGEFFIPPRSAYTAQVPVLFSEPVRSNILLGLEREDGEVAAAIHAAVLDDDIAAMAEGTDTIVGVKGVQVSGGQRHRIAAARCLVRRPELIVLDDLSSALDVDTERLLWQRLLALKDHSFLVVSHRRAVLGRADRILVMAGGRVIDRGTSTELLERCGEYRAIWERA